MKIYLVESEIETLRKWLSATESLDRMDIERLLDAAEERCRLARELRKRQADDSP